MSKNREFLLIEGEPQIIEVGRQGPAGPPGTVSPTQFTVTYAASMTVNWELGDIAVITLTGNATIAFSGTRKKGMVVLIQDGTGGRLVTWDTATVGFGVDIPDVPLTAVPSKTDYIGFVRNPTTGKYDVAAYARGY